MRADVHLQRSRHPTLRLPHHDAGAVRDALGDIPLAGFFAAGELGPISGRNFLHGFTASLVIFGQEP